VSSIEVLFEENSKRDKGTRTDKRRRKRSLRCAE
jgi:hypothetical protein